MATPNIPPTLPANAVVKLIELYKPATHRYAVRVTPPCFALLIDNAFTPQECRDMLLYATSETGAVNGSGSDSSGDGGGGSGGGGRWEAALINTSHGQQKLAPEVRNCGRILRDDPELAAKLFARIAPLLRREAVDVVSPHGRWQGMKSAWLGDTPWRLTRLNERLRFLKYGPGEYFRRMFLPPSLAQRAARHGADDGGGEKSSLRRLILHAGRQ